MRFEKQAVEKMVKIFCVVRGIYTVCYGKRRVIETFNNR